MNEETRDALLDYAERLQAILTWIPQGEQKAMEEWLKNHSIPTPIQLDGYARQIKRELQS